MIIGSDVLKLSREQVEDMMRSQFSRIYHVKPGDVMSWRCGHPDCPYVFVERAYAEDDVDLGRDWPDAIITHIWMEGHYQWTVN